MDRQNLGNKRGEHGLDGARSLTMVKGIKFSPTRKELERRRWTYSQNRGRRQQHHFFPASSAKSAPYMKIAAFPSLSRLAIKAQSYASSAVMGSPCILYTCVCGQGVKRFEVGERGLPYTGTCMPLRASSDVSCFHRIE